MPYFKTTFVAFNQRVEQCTYDGPLVEANDYEAAAKLCKPFGFLNVNPNHIDTRYGQPPFWNPHFGVDFVLGIYPLTSEPVVEAETVEKEAEPETKQFRVNVGDRVILTSGGPIMTVIEVDAFNDCQCTYYNGTEYLEVSFASHALTPLA